MEHVDKVRVIWTRSGAPAVEAWRAAAGRQGTASRILTILGLLLIGIPLLILLCILAVGIIALGIALVIVGRCSRFIKGLFGGNSKAIQRTEPGRENVRVIRR
ncbi:MAG: hypothetical protein CMJ32_01905 [Phycisphaerae bacterium]|nr:hypothetical protein [Phycisphaerae bacterium]